MNDGLLLFAKYAYPPNLLGYCGPGDSAALRGYLQEASRADSGLKELAQHFEGAYPYLRLIAHENGIADPFDLRVVEAYWVGNELLDRVGAAPFFESLVSRFRPRMSGRSFSQLAGLLPHGARPHHNFHVFDVYRRAGLMRDDRALIALERMDQCRVSWGRVVSVQGAAAVVQRSALVLRDGRLGLGEPSAVSVVCRAPLELAPGDYVSLHWGWVCDLLDRRTLAGLVRATRRSMAHASTTL